MTTITSFPAGAPCWIELSTTNADKSRAFYGELFGWTSEEAGPEYGGYINFSKDGERIAGCMQQEGVPEFWLTYLHSDNAERTVKDAEANGAVTHVPVMPVMDLGTMAMVMGPDGAAIGIWQPGSHSGFTVRGEPSAPGWFELHTRDYDKSVAFYRDVFHWDAHTAIDEPDFKYTTLGEGEGQLAGIMDAKAFLPEDLPAHWAIYFDVESTDAALEKAVGLGAAVVQAAEDTPYGRLASLTDPNGALFKLIENNVS